MNASTSLLLSLILSLALIDKYSSRMAIRPEYHSQLQSPRDLIGGGVDVELQVEGVIKGLESSLIRSGLRSLGLQRKNP